MVIESYADSGRLDEMEAAVRRMFENKRMFATPKTLEALILAYTRVGAYDRLGKSMEMVKGAGWIIQSDIYNLLISEYGKGEQLEKMKQVYEEMVTAAVSPSLETFLSMLDAFDKCGLEAEMSRTIGLMRKAGFDSPTLSQPADRMWTDDEIFGGRSR
jgi:pentatricopeptide repeat protein